MPNFPAAKLMDVTVGVDVHAATLRLRQMGLSSLGATQVLSGREITSAADRAVVARIVAWAASNLAGRRA